MLTRTVYVVAWEFESGGGHYWYHTKAHADEAYQEELKNVRFFKKENWKATQFTAIVPQSWSADEITNEIDAHLWHEGFVDMGAAIDLARTEEGVS